MTAALSVELTVTRFAKTGEGVASHEGRSVFIDGVLPGEVVRVVLVEDGKIVRGTDAVLVQKAPSRRQAPCSLAGTCGGCDWLHVPEPQQVEAKAEAVRSALERIGRLDLSALDFRPPHVGEKPLGYRRRATLHVGNDRLGFHARRTHGHVAVDECPALVDVLTNVPGQLGALLGKTLSALDEVRLLAVGHHVAAHFVTRKVPTQALVAMLAKVSRTLKFKGASVQGPDGASTQVVEGKVELADGDALVRPDGFAQTNAAVNDALVSEAVGWATEASPQKAVELYAGNGNFTLHLAKTVPKIYAIESSSLSVSLGQRAATKSGRSGIRWFIGDADKLCEGLAEERETFDVVLADPPRTGAPLLSTWCHSFRAQRVVYVSCDSASLARDAANLVAAGYRATRLRIFDMFPQTHHVETLMLFER